MCEHTHILTYTLPTILTSGLGIDYFIKQWTSHVSNNTITSTFLHNLCSRCKGFLFCLWEIYSGPWHWGTSAADKSRSSYGGRMIAARNTSSPGICSSLIIFLAGSNSFILKVTFKSVLLSLFCTSLPCSQAYMRFSISFPLGSSYLICLLGGVRQGEGGE